MLDNLIRDAKLAAMQAVGEVKELVHDVTTKMPEQVQDFSKPQDFGKPQAQPMEYMSGGWGMMASTMTANQIDMIADKQNFIANMIQNELLGFDGIEQELRAMAQSPTPPQPAQLISLAARIDTYQRQAYNGLQELRKLSQQVDQATDKLQNGGQQGWSSQIQTNAWNR